MNFFYDFLGSTFARHGAEQKFILFDESHPEKYESTNFFYDLFLCGHPLNRMKRTSYNYKVIYT